MQTTAPKYAPKYVPPTLVEAIRQLSGDTKRGFVFVRPDGSERFCSFSDIHGEAERRGAHLRVLGLEKGDRVALVIPDGDEFVLSFLGAIYAGVVPVPMYPQLSFKNVETYHETVAHITRASGAKFLLTTKTTRPFVDPVTALLAADAGSPALLRGIFNADDVFTASDGTPLPAPSRLEVPVGPEDFAFFQFTSGSTSRPKGVMVTHANLAANSEAFMVHGLGKDSSVDKGVSWLPLFHDMGLIGFVIGPLFTNIPVVFLPTASFVRAPRIWLDTIHKHRGTITYAPNFAYALVSKRLKDKDVAGLDLSCLRITGCGAEPIQAKTLREFADKLAPAGFKATSYLPSYGMAEATLAVTFVPHGTGMHSDFVDGGAMQGGQAKPAILGAAGAQELVSCGRPFPGHEVAIVDERGKALGDRQIGQIVTRGPSITPGYYDEPELTAESFRTVPAEGGRAGGTWLYTGDLGYLADGELYICGRLKDIIIIRGRNFYPQDIEWVVSELPGVRRGNVVAFGAAVDAQGRYVHDGGGEEQLVVCAEAFQSDAAGLVDAIQQAVAAHMGVAVHKVEIVGQGALPRTSSGKPQRRKTKQMFLDGTFARARAVQSSSDRSEATAD